MTMKNIYFVEAGFSFDNDIYIPYATGCIASFMKKNGCFDEEYNLAGFIYKKEPTDRIIEKLDDPCIVGFSCCIWNQNFNLELAKKVKERFPRCTVIFGGHNITRDNNFLKHYPFIDILVFGEGEKAFCDTVKNLSDGKLTEVSNISFRRNGTVFVTAEAVPCELTDFPSPYLSGIFDDILNEEEHSSLLCILETNRGCPYSCSYCDWCSGKKVRLFPLEKVKKELQWIAENGLEYCFCADSNFGMFDRDIEITRHAASMKEKYSYPKVFKTCFAKYSNDTVFEICSILNKAGMDKGATLAYQSLSEDVLKNINRKNLTLEHFSGLLKKYYEAGIPAYSELILGLPGETKKSFCEGICKVIESGQHNSLSIYYLELLPNSEMSKKTYMAKHKINPVKIGFNHMHSSGKKDEIKEYSNIVQSTATLSKKDWIYCNLFSVCIQTFHALGLLRYIAIYLNKEENISYFDFYSALLEFILNAKNTVLYDLFSSFEEKLSSSLEGEWNFKTPDFGDISWAFEEGAYLTFLKEIDSISPLLTQFSAQFFKNKELFFQLMDYQLSVLRKPGYCNSEKEFLYDFAEFFDCVTSGKAAVLHNKKVTYCFTEKKSFGDWKAFAKETVWFGRRKGATMFSTNRNSDAVISVK